jgi:predicted alpha/beta-fold hydrolase
MSLALTVAALLGLLLVLILFQLTRTNRLNVVVNPQGSVAPILARMKLLNQPYRPTPWLIGGVLQTVYGMRFRKRSKLIGTEKRVVLDLFDGGTLALDFFIPPEPAPDAPFILVVPTLGGSTWEPCTNNCVEALYDRGWPSVVMNGRGFAGLKFQTPRFGVAFDHEDIRDTLAYVVEQYKPPHLIVVGFSMGSMQAMSYITRDAPLVDAAVVVSHSYDAVRSACLLESGLQKKFLTPAILRSLNRTMQKNPFAKQEDKDIARRCRTLREFDDHITGPSRGFANADGYYAQVAIEEKIPLVKVPTLVFGAENDPLIRPSFLPLKSVGVSENVALVHVREGGHVSFLTGWDAQRSLTDAIVPDFVSAVIANKLARS